MASPSHHQVSVSYASLFQGIDNCCNLQRKTLTATTMAGAWPMVAGSSRYCAQSRDAPEDAARQPSSSLILLMISLFFRPTTALASTGSVKYYYATATPQALPDYPALSSALRKLHSMKTSDDKRWHLNPTLPLVAFQSPVCLLLEQSATSSWYAGARIP